MFGVLPVGKVPTQAISILIMAIIGLLIAYGIASMPGNVKNAYLLIEHQIVRRFSLAQEAQRKAMKRNADNKGYAPLTAPPFEKGGRKLSNKFAVISTNYNLSHYSM